MIGLELWLLGVLALLGFGLAWYSLRRSRHREKEVTQADLRRTYEQIQRQYKAEAEAERRRREYERWQRENEARKAREKAEREALEKQASEEPKPVVVENKLYAEKTLPWARREFLFAKGYKRLKISPYGASGAAYYWVQPRYNESKEHAFFCYLIQAEVQRYTKKLELHVTGGPDVVFSHAGKEYCFDVETGSNAVRNPVMLKRKFARYREKYARSFVLVTSKKLKYRYAKYGEVVTRSTLKKTIHSVFHP